jgi:transposase
MVVIGENTSERLDVIICTVPRSGDATAEAGLPGMLGRGGAAAAPPRLIEGGLPTEATVAHVLVARYADHLPLYRPTQMMARRGVAIVRSTLAFWVGYAAAER